MYRTADPVRDAERSQEEPEREYIVCDVCGERIYKADDNNNGDEYYQVGDKVICEECIGEFRKECA